MERETLSPVEIISTERIIKTWKLDAHLRVACGGKYESLIHMEGRGIAYT